MKDNLGASQATGLAGAEAPEPPSRLGPTGGIPCAWQPIETCPMWVPVLVAYHGHGENRTHEVVRVKENSPVRWGDFDYINSHDGEPKYWMPLPEPPDDLAGPDCGCDGCTEEHYGGDEE